MSAADTRPKILITGKNGQVGWELCRSLQPHGELVALGRDQLDLTNENEIRRVIREQAPDIIVNAAAYTAVDDAEDDAERAFAINAHAPAIMAEEAKNLGALLIHYSTDYVFDGRDPEPYTEQSTTNPLNIYGESKLAGERAIQASAADHLIFRTSWVYGPRGSNFLLTMLRLMKEREELSVVGDQFGAPTPAYLIADVTAQAVACYLREHRDSEFNSGLYHLVSRGRVSWYGFACEIRVLLDKSALKPEPKVRDIMAVTSAEYPTRALRPAHSTLSVASLERRFEVCLPAWQDALKVCFRGVQETSP